MPTPDTPKTELRRQIADFYRDLDLLKDGWTPDERALRDAPLIENWCLDVHSEGDAAPGILVLRGIVSGHPRFPGVIQIRTSKLFALNRKEGWARTASRFYRLGSSPYDETAPDRNSHAVRELKDYVALFQSLPQPTLDQMWAFARHVSTAHSWYKHLPPFPPGAPFYFYVDPAAGMQHAVAPDGSMQVLVREKPGFHYSWLPTSEYREKFGCLAYAQSRGTSVSMFLPNGFRLIPSDDQPAFYRADRAQVCAVPKAILALGTSYVSRIVNSARVRDLHGTLPPRDASRDTWLRRWPEESGGPQQLEKIESRVNELRRNPSCRRAPSVEDYARYPHIQAEDMELHSLLKPERERQQRLMVEACSRVSNYIWNGSFLTTVRPREGPLGSE